MPFRAEIQLQDARFYGRLEAGCHVISGASVDSFSFKSQLRGINVSDRINVLFSKAIKSHLCST